MAHDHAARVARQALRRFRGNADAVLEDGLAGMIGVRQHRGVDVDDDLVALARGAGIDAVVEGRLGQQGQGVGLLLLHRRRSADRRSADVGGRDRARARWYSASRAASSALTSRAPDLRGQPAPDPHGAVVVLIHVQGPARVLPGGLAGLGLAVHPAPAAHDPLDVLGGAGAADLEQALFGLRRGDAGEGADLRVGQLAAREGLGQERQRSPGRARRGPSRGPRRGRGRSARSATRRRSGSRCSSRRRASNSRMRSSRRAVAASRCADSSAISSPRRCSLPRSMSRVPLVLG